ncbi:hypothetical protein HMI54_007195 [Coelomomyces lativittatus]|nr:hypothetical protein HMI55_001095 [Coelomomyces lativittatus]KAJ1515280.1 hypothetical protein HMI56_006063 [Coelomomyces lativittatus]KAJ1517078.1 hypothetical protein HMI54_007195 [Coelomomyces lativittatus]
MLRGSGSGSTSTYKGSNSTLLLSCQGVASPLAQWNVVHSTHLTHSSSQIKHPPLSTSSSFSHHIQHQYEKDIKGYCIQLNSQSIKLNYSFQGGGSPHPFLAIQLYLPQASKKFTLEVTTLDTTESSKRINKRHLFFSTANKEVKVTPLHAAIPISSYIKRDEWCSLLLDLSMTTTFLYPTHQYAQLTHLQLSSDQVKVRWVCTFNSVHHCPYSMAWIPSTSTSETPSKHSSPLHTHPGSSLPSSFLPSLDHPSMTTTHPCVVRGQVQLPFIYLGVHHDSPFHQHPTSSMTSRASVSPTTSQEQSTWKTGLPQPSKIPSLSFTKTTDPLTSKGTNVSRFPKNRPKHRTWSRTLHGRTCTPPSTQVCFTPCMDNPSSPDVRTNSSEPVFTPMLESKKHEHHSPVNFEDPPWTSEIQRPSNEEVTEMETENENENEMDQKETTKKNILDDEQDDESLELMYDEVHQCYFDPLTGKYYQLL